MSREGEGEMKEGGRGIGYQASVLKSRIQLKLVRYSTPVQL